MANRHWRMNRPLVVLLALVCQQCCADEEEEQERLIRKDTSNWIYVCELLLVIFLSLLFEKVQDWLVHKFKTMGRQGESLRLMMECLTNEIMILGFIGLLVYVATKTDMALDIARRLYPSNIKLTEEDDPLAETFETVHMIIFCVMVCFIVQVTLLMYKAAYLESQKWAHWEHIRVGKFTQAEEQQDEKTPRPGEKKYSFLEREEKARLETIASMLQDAGYYNAETGMQKELILETNPFRRMLSQSGVEHVLQWRLLRHQFLFPAHDDDSTLSQADLVDKACHTPAQYKPKEPAFFQFAKYLDIKLGQTFCELIEVDASTWAMCAVFSLGLPYILSFDPYWYSTFAACFSWLVVCVMFFFGAHVHDIYIKLSPDVEDHNPQAYIDKMRGTSATALRGEHRRKGHNSVKVRKDGAKGGHQHSPAKMTHAKGDTSIQPSLEHHESSRSLGDTSFQQSLGFLDSSKPLGDTSFQQSLGYLDSSKSLAEPLLRGVSYTEDSLSPLHANLAGANTLKKRTTQGERLSRRFTRRFVKREWDSIFYAPNAEGGRPTYLRILKRLGLVKLEKKAPNPQERLFAFHEDSPALYKHFVGDLLFIQSVVTSMYLVIWCICDIEWGWYQVASTAFGMCGPLLNLFLLVPKVVGKMVIITSIEYMKDKASVEDVVFENKRHQLLESIKILEIARMEGKVERIAGGNKKLDQATKDKYENIYATELSEKKRKDIKHMFEMFDEDQSGSISKEEMQSIFSSMNIDENSNIVDAANKLWDLVDDDGSGHVEFEEFRVLMAMVLHKDQKMREEDDRALFKKFDEDDSEEITIAELTTGFASLGVELDENSIAALVGQVFHGSRQKLGEEDFVCFMKGLEEMSELA